MRLIFVMDGTVPVLAARVFAVDGYDEHRAEIDDALAGLAYVHDVPDVIGKTIPVRWVVVDVNENGGIDNVLPASSETDAQDTAATMCDVEADPDDGWGDVFRYVDPGHFVVTYREGQDDESYAHAFRVGGAS